MKVSSFYSVAGISTSLFCDTPSGRILMEAGDGCLRDLIELERHAYEKGEGPPPGIEKFLGVIISHPHYDHYSGLLNLLNFLHLLQRKGTLRIIYPEGAFQIESMVDHFLSTLWEDCPFGIELMPCGGITEIHLGDVMIRTIPVTHRYSRPGAVGGPLPAMGYSISYSETTISYSGDTCGGPDLEPLFRDADLGIVETTFDETPVGHEEVHMNVRESCRMGSLSKEHWHIHFTAASYEAVQRKCTSHNELQRPFF